MEAGNARLFPPMRGVTDQMPHADRPGDTNAPGRMLNVLPHTSVGGRRVIAQRPGLRKTFPNRPTSGKPVNGMGIITRSLNIARGWEEREPIVGPTATSSTGTSRPQTVPTGKAVTVLGMDGAILQGFADPDYATATGIGTFGRTVEHGTQTAWTGGSLGVGGWICKVNKAYGGAIGNKIISRVHVFKSDANGVLSLDFTVEVEDKEYGEAVAAGATPIHAQCARLVGPYLIVAASKYVYCFDARPTGVLSAQGRYLGRANFGDWAWIVENLDTWATGPDASREGEYANARGFVFACCRGNPTIGGPVDDATYQQGGYIRASVEMIRLNFPETETSLPPTRPMMVGDASFLRLAGGAKLVNHGEDQAGFRPAEHIDGRGRALISLELVGPFESQGLDNAFDRAAWTGKVMIASSNDGFGDALVPDGSNGYYNLLEVSWPTTLATYRTPSYAARDMVSRKAVWLTPSFLTDIPFDINGGILSDTGVGPKSSLACIRANNQGRWYSGSFADGKHVRGAPLFSTGATQEFIETWTKQLGTHVGREAMDAASWPEQGVNHVVACGERNNTWENSGAAYASVWLMNARNGSLVHSWDLGASVDVRSASFVRAGSKSVILVSHQIT